MRPVGLGARVRRAQRLLLLTGCLISGVLGLAAVDAHAATPSSLAGETFTSKNVKGSTLTGACTGNGNQGAFKFTVSGTAAGPFPGTFTESGSFTTALDGFPMKFSSTFTIMSTAGTVTGTGSLSGIDAGTASCSQVGNQDDLRVDGFALAYAATIDGTQHDTGTTTLTLFGALGTGVLFTFNENFSATAVVPNGCRHGGRRTIAGTARADRLIGTRGADVIVGGAGNDRIRAGGGDDLVCAGSGGDRVAGGPGNDRLLGGPGNDFIAPGPGRDRVFAGAGADLIVSIDSRRDVIDCGPGLDVASVDRVDRTRRCEIVIRLPGSRPRAARARRTGPG